MTRQVAMDADSDVVVEHTQGQAEKICENIAILLGEIDKPDEDVLKLTTRIIDPAREQRTLSRKAYESNNWENQRQKVAECHRRIKHKRRDFLHKLSNYYAREYDLVAVEDLDVKEMLEPPGNSRNTAAAESTFTDLLEYKCKREGTHFLEVDPAGTIKECASCGVETDKPLWVREHSCPACGFEADRDANAVVRPRLMGSKREAFATAWNIRSRGLSKLGVGHSEDTSVETALPTGTAVVPAKRVHQTPSGGLSDAV